MESLITTIGVGEFNDLINSSGDQSLKNLGKFTLFKHNNSKDYTYLEDLLTLKQESRFDSILSAEITIYKAKLLIESSRVFEATLTLKDLIKSYGDIEYGSIYERGIEILYKYDLEVADDLLKRGIWKKARFKYLDIVSYNPNSIDLYRGIVESSVMMYDERGFLALANSILDKPFKFLMDLTTRFCNI